MFDRDHPRLAQTGGLQRLHLGVPAADLSAAVATEVTAEEADQAVVAEVVAGGDRYDLTIKK